MTYYRDQPGMDAGMNAIDPAPMSRNARGAPENPPQCPPHHPKPAPARKSRVDLIQIIEGEIIPRLFLAHRNRVPHPLVGAAQAAGELGDSAFLAELFVGGDAPDIVSRLQKLLGEGMRRDRLYLDLLAPIPGTLSRLWAEGRCSFDEIARGLGCLDEVLRQLHEREHTAPEAN